MDMAAINAMLQTPNVQMGGMQDALGTDAGLQGLFAMLFGQMLNGADGEALAEDPMLGTLFSSMGDETDDTQLQLAMQMMAGTLMGPQAMDLLLGQTDGAALDGIMQTAQTQSLLLEQLQAQLALAGQQAEAQADSNVHDADWDALLNTLTTAWETGEDSESTAPVNEMDQVQFASAVRQVRELMADKARGAKEEPTQPLDVEALQAAVDSRQYVPDTVSARQETPDVQEIADQLKTGILDNLRQGKNEFVVKLKPEGLGEITVKLTESKNEISLRIVTSSAAVGRMIANDVNALQNALRPLRAQVQEIVTVPAAQENAAGTMLTGGQGEQQFAWHYQEQQQSGSGRAHADDGGDFDDLVEEIVPDDANVNVLI
ncbi:MAG: flagellar hook-length control protein FliK [Subdoligranulum sp.]|nr:flagellar hook-length control protein FliK [Subdoligranulum sp.]